MLIEEMLILVESKYDDESFAIENLLALLDKLPEKKKWLNKSLSCKKLTLLYKAIRANCDPDIARLLIKEGASIT